MSTQSIAKRTPIQELPTELLLSISEFLPTHGIVALSLTCKDIYLNEDMHKTWKYALYNNQRHSHPSSNLLRPSTVSFQTETLTRLLQKDMPLHYFCNICSRLHPQRNMSRAECDSWQTCTRYPTRGKWLHYETWNLHLSFDHLCQKYSRDIRDTGSASLPATLFLRDGYHITTIVGHGKRGWI